MQYEASLLNPYLLLCRSANEYHCPEKARTAGWLCGLFYFSILSSNIPYQIIGGIGGKGRIIIRVLLILLKKTQISTKYSQKIHIMLACGEMSARRLPRNLNDNPPYSDFGGVAMLGVSEKKIFLNFFRNHQVSLGVSLLGLFTERTVEGG